MRRSEGLPPKTTRDFAKRLGAPQSTVFEISLSIAIVLAIVGFKFFPSLEAKKIASEPVKEMVSIEDVEITRQQERPPAPARPPVVIESPSDEMLNDIPLMDSELSGAPDAPPPMPKSADADEEYFIAVEELPEPIGGMSGLRQNVIYPELAKRAGLQGKVMIVAFVSEKGEVVKAEVLKSLGAGCDEAALNAVLKTKFTPGKQRGKPVKTRIAIPVEFRLSS